MTISAHLASPRITYLLAAMAALDTMAVDMYAPAFPALTREFGVSSNAVQATMSIFLIGAALGQLVLGPLLDRYGRRRPILAGVSSFALGSLVCTMAPGYKVFMVGRLIQSLGAATALVAPRTVIADIYPAKDVARAFSVIMQIMMIAPVVAPILGATLLSHFGWRANFIALTLFGLAHLLASWFLLPETLPAPHRVARQPLGIVKAYLALLAQRRFFLLVLSGGFVGATLYAFLGAAPFALIADYGVSPLSFSLIIGGISLTLILFGWANIRLLGRFSESRLLGVAFGIQLVAAGALAMLTYAAAPSLAVYVVLVGIAIGALGIIFPNVSALAMAESGPDVGMASAVVGIAQSALSASAGAMLVLTGADNRGMMIAIGVFAALALAAQAAGMAAPAVSDNKEPGVRVT